MYIVIESIDHIHTCEKKNNEYLCPLLPHCLVFNSESETMWGVKGRNFGACVNTDDGVVLLQFAVVDYAVPIL